MINDKLSSLIPLIDANCTPFSRPKQSKGDVKFKA